jgi:hypothetical protein
MRPTTRRPIARATSCAAAGLALASATALIASSHREAPLITAAPKLDCTDFYMFNSYEPGRGDYVTVIANYVPLQDAYGGPNYFTLATVFEGRYEIHFDNNGDAQEDITFQFRFSNTRKNIALPIGPDGNQRTNAVPVINVGPIAANNTAALNVVESFSIDLITGHRRSGTIRAVTNLATGATSFPKPVDNIGNKSVPDYETYARSHIAEFAIPGHANGRVFVGQRKDPFVVNLGETFDLVNISTSPLGPPDANRDSLYYKNVTAIVLELPKSFLRSAPDKPVIGAWTSASRIDRTTPTPAIARSGVALQDHNLNVIYTQLSRLGHPLVNEVVIGLKDKDAFNASEPKDDLQFLDYVTHPTLPTIIELLYGAAGVKAPTLYPRNDLVTVFLTGVEGLNKDGSVGEMLRLNTAIAAVPAAQQNALGVIGGDNTGFPNGRRVGDDVVDIALRVVMGRLITLGLFGTPDQAPSGGLEFTDGAAIHARMFPERFPYLNAPIAGSPNDPTIQVLLQSAAQVQGAYENATGVTYDAASRTFSADTASPDAGFYRLKANGNVTMSPPKVEGSKVRIGLR